MVIEKNIHIYEEYALLMPKKHRYLSLEYCSNTTCYMQAEYGDIKKRLATACYKHAGKNYIRFRFPTIISEKYTKPKKYIKRHFAPITYNRLDKIFKQKESCFKRQDQKITNTYLDLMDTNVIYPCILSFII